MVHPKLIIAFTTLASLCSASAIYWKDPAQQVLGIPHETVQAGDAWRSGKPAFPHQPGRLTNGFVALGDSYSAGIGTSSNGTENDCRVGQNAYPNLIFRDLAALRGLPDDRFQHLSCTGATIEDALAGAEHSQVDGLNLTDNADFALLSIGGNDLGFFEIMNSCIFRFYSFVSGTCDDALRKSSEQIASPLFDQRLRLLIMEVLDKVKWERKPSFTIFVTGYAQFFNAETKDCDKHSLGVWWRGPKLKRKLRRQMNNMVKDVNRKIQESIDVINAGFAEPRVFFVDYNDAFDGHRFCEPNVTEPDYKRNDTWFFLVGGQDNNEPVKLPDELMAPGPRCDLDEATGAESHEECLGLTEFAAMQDSKDFPEFFVQNSMWYVPTYYGKTFHPVSSSRSGGSSQP